MDNPRLENDPRHELADARCSTARIARLFVYPVKSCAGVELQRGAADRDRAGPRPRLDGGGRARASSSRQRELPRMALVRPQLKHYEVVLRAPGMLALHLAIDAVEQPVQVRVWDDEVAAYDMGDVAAQWFSDFLGPASCGWCASIPSSGGCPSLKWTGGRRGAEPVQRRLSAAGRQRGSLAELNARLAAAGHAAVGIERFRPNIVLAGLGGARRRPARRRCGSPPPRARCGCGRSSPARAARSPTSTRPPPRSQPAGGATRCRPTAGTTRGRRGDFRHERDRAEGLDQAAAGRPGRHGQLALLS